MIEAKRLQSMAVAVHSPVRLNWAESRSIVVDDAVMGRVGKAVPKVTNGTKIVFSETMVNSGSLNEPMWTTELIGRRVGSRIARSNARTYDRGLEGSGNWW